MSVALHALSLDLWRGRAADALIGSTREAGMTPNDQIALGKVLLEVSD